MSLSVGGVVQHVRSRCPCSRVWHLPPSGLSTYKSLRSYNTRNSYTATNCRQLLYIYTCNKRSTRRSFQPVECSSLRNCFLTYFTSDGTFTEIPEPDYDDSDDDIIVVNEPASGFYDNEPDKDNLPETRTQRVDDDDDDGGDSAAEVDQAVDDASETYDFDDVRAKLEAFSLEQHQLRGSASAADQGCQVN